MSPKQAEDPHKDDSTGKRRARGSIGGGREIRWKAACGYIGTRSRSLTAPAIPAKSLGGERASQLVVGEFPNLRSIRLCATCARSATEALAVVLDGLRRGESARTQRCSWAGCPEANELGHMMLVGGHPFCAIHHLEMLRETILRGPRDGVTEGKISDHCWLNRRARFVELTATEEEKCGLTKGKIETRTFRFEWTPPVVKFSIERHPAGFVYEQQWSFDAFHARLNLLS